MDTIKLKDTYPLLSVKDNRCITSTGDTILCYVLDLPEVFTLSKEDYVSIHNFWYRTLKYLPKNTFVHRQDVFLKDEYTGDDLPNSTFLQKATVKHFSGRSYLEHRSYLFIGNSRTSFLAKKGMMNPFKKVTKKQSVIDELKVDAEFVDEVEKSISFLNASKYIKAYKLSEDEIHSIVMHHYNGYQRDKYVDTDLEAKVNTNTKAFNAVGVGDKRVGIYTLNSIKQFPDYVDTYKIDGDYSSKKFQIFKGVGDDFGFKMNFNHVYNQIIYIDDYSQHKKELEEREKQLSGAAGFARENKINAEQIGDILDEMAKDETIKIVRAHSNVIFYADTDEQFQKYSNIISTIYRGLDFEPKYPSTKRVIKEIYSKSLFAYVSTLNNDNIFKIDLKVALTNYLNITSYKTDDDGVVFTDRIFGVPVKRDIRDEEKKRIKAWNFFIYGPTGEGKSVLAQEIFRQLLEQGKKIVIFDIGASFQKLSYLVPPEKSIYFNYEDGKSIGLNPFYISIKDSLDADKLTSLAQFCYGLYKPSEEMSQQTKAALVKLLDTYYTHIDLGHNFPNFYNFLRHNVDELKEELNIKDSYFDINEFLFVCEKFIDGEYDFLFEDSEDISYRIQDKQLVVFEFEQANKNQILLALLMQLANEAVERVVLADRSVDGLIFYDELAKFIKDKNIRSKVAYYYATNRKYNASIGTALQTPNQLPQGEDTEAMIENSQVIYILNNDNGYEPIVERYKLSEHQHNILKSITPNLNAKNPYTEFGLIIGKDIWIMRLELPKENFYTYQTDGKDYEAIMSIFKENNDMEASIKKYIQLKH